MNGHEFGIFPLSILITTDAEGERATKVLRRLGALGCSPLVLASPRRENPHLGCYLAHWQAIKTAIERGAPPTIVFEDDALFRDDVLDQLEKGKPHLDAIKNWDLCYLGANVNSSSKRWNVSGPWWSADKIYHFHSVAIAGGWSLVALDRAYETNFHGSSIGRGNVNDALVNRLHYLKRVYHNPILSVQESGHSMLNGKHEYRFSEYFREGHFDQDEFIGHCQEAADAKKAMA